jgi:hypothetical protein
MPKAIHQKLLLVEGADELRTIPELIEKNGVLWESRKGVPIVQIKDCKGYANLSDPIGIKAELSAVDRTALGILLDADEDPINR